MMKASTKLTVTLVAKDASSLGEAARRALAAGADLVEVRVDLLDAPDAAGVARVLDAVGAGKAIVTCRQRSQGGRFAGDEDERIGLIAELVTGRDVLVDLEFEVWRAESAVRGTISRALGGDLSRLILSEHNFERRPADPAGIVDAMRRANPHGVAKLAWQAADVRDCLDAFELMAAGDGRTIAICMGEAGVPSRVLAGKFGAFLTFASLADGAEAAPGQVSVEQMRRSYRWDRLGEATRVYGVVGWPVGHSMSPAIHNTAFGETGVDAVYLAMPVEPTYEAFAGFVTRAMRLDGLNLGGLSVTIPHKPHALRMAGRMEPLAGRIGAANTLVFEPDRTPMALNTDYAGVLDALTVGMACERDDLAGKRVAVLGAGGAARAVVAGLCDCRCEVTIYNRTAARAKALAEEFACGCGEFELRGRLVADIVVNTTSVGMHPNVDASPLPAEAMKAGMVVFETIYNPLRTLLLQQAQQAGCVTVTGLEMFVSQAVLQYEAWLGQPAPRELMRDVVAERLRSG